MILLVIKRCCSPRLVLSNETAPNLLLLSFLFAMNRRIHNPFHYFFKPTTCPSFELSTPFCIMKYRFPSFEWICFKILWSLFSKKWPLCDDCLTKTIALFFPCRLIDRYATTCHEVSLPILNIFWFFLVFFFNFAHWLNAKNNCWINLNMKLKFTLFISLALYTVNMTKRPKRYRS